MAVTTDAAGNNGTFCRNLVPEMREKWNLPHVKYPDCHVYCFAHILNLAVQDFLDEVKCGAPMDEENAYEETWENRGQRMSVLKKVCYLLLFRFVF